MSDGLIRKEIQEAIDAGERALRSLAEARKCLNSAGNWGIVDLFGGNLISGIMKHSKIRNASSYIERARADMLSFERELRDVDGYVQDINISDFLVFADFFFDGFIADVLVQSRIAQMKRQVDDAISRVRTIVSQLRMQL